MSSVTRTIADMLELKIPPLVVVIITATGMWVVAHEVSILRYALPGAAGIGAGIAIAGIVVAVMGVFEFRRVGTTVDPRVPAQSARLVTSGIYQYSRNPMYLGFLLMLCGWAWFLGSVVSLLFIAAFVGYLNRWQITPEERAMRAKFAESFGDYTSSVRRWL